MELPKYVFPHELPADNKFYVLFGDPSLDPIPSLTLHEDFNLVQGTGGKVFLQYSGQEYWLACTLNNQIERAISFGVCG